MPRSGNIRNTVLSVAPVRNQYDLANRTLLTEGFPL